MRKADNNKRKHTFIVLALVCCLLFNSTAVKVEKADALATETVAVLAVITASMIASGIVFNNSTASSTFVGKYFENCSPSTKAMWQDVADGVESFVDGVGDTVKRRAQIPEFLKHDIIEYSQAEGLVNVGDSVSALDVLDSAYVLNGQPFSPYDNYGHQWFYNITQSSYWAVNSNPKYDEFYYGDHIIHIASTGNEDTYGRELFRLYLDAIPLANFNTFVYTNPSHEVSYVYHIVGCWSTSSHSSIALYINYTNKTMTFGGGKVYDWVRTNSLTYAETQLLLFDEFVDYEGAWTTASDSYGDEWSTSAEDSPVYIPTVLTDTSQSATDYSTAVGGLSVTGVRDNRIPDIDSGETDIEGGLTIGGLWTNLGAKLDEIIIGVKSIPTVIGNLGTGILDGIRTWWDSLTQSAVDSISGTLESARDWITQVVAPEFVSILDGAKSVVSTFPQYFEDLIHHYIPSPLSDVLVIGIFSGVLILLLRMLLGV